MVDCSYPSNTCCLSSPFFNLFHSSQTLSPRTSPHPHYYPLTPNPSHIEILITHLSPPLILSPTSSSQSSLSQLYFLSLPVPLTPTPLIPSSSLPLLSPAQHPQSHQSTSHPHQHTHTVTLLSNPNSLSGPQASAFDYLWATCASSL